MTHKLGEIPTPPPDEYAADAEILRVAMQLAIPTEDWGSRGAVQYAAEIAEFLAYMHVELTRLPTFDPDFIEARKASLLRMDGPQTV